MLGEVVALDGARVHLLPFGELDGVGPERVTPARGHDRIRPRRTGKPERRSTRRIRGVAWREGVALAAGNPLIWAYARGGSGKAARAGGMNPEVIVTCAVTGAGDTVGKHPGVPVTPKQIAEAAIEAAKAGAAIAHCHVRDPKTGKGARDPALYREVVERIRGSGTDVVINLTAGMGGDFEVGPDDEPTRAGAATDFVGPLERLVHIAELRPEICSLDCGSLNFGDDNLVVVNTPRHLRAGARRIQELGVKPELEIFDTGNLWFAKQMLAEGLIEQPPLFQLCMGIPWGMPAEPELMKAVVGLLPPGANWTGFGIGRMQLPIAAQAVLLGGHVRVGLEDNLHLERGVLASNAQLVEKAVRIVLALGARVLGPAQARARLGLRTPG